MATVLGVSFSCLFATAQAQVSAPVAQRDKTPTKQLTQTIRDAIAVDIEKVSKERESSAVAGDRERIDAAARRARIANSLTAPDGAALPDRTLGAATGSVAASAGPAANAVPAASAVAAPNAMAPRAAEQRIALVIGNSAYKVSPLANPTNDARAMAVKLQQLGFTVIRKENADREEMMTAAREFGNQLKNGGVGLFYYAGHGVQSKGINYLVPVDSNINSEDELSTRAYSANELLEKMDTAKNRVNMVILDACRDNPFARSFRSASRGLAGIEQAPSGTLIAYATSPGSVASDGSGSNGLYTEQLLQAMSEPGLKIEDVFKRVRVNVMDRSAGKQTPWEMSSVTGDFYFNPTAEQAAMALASAAPALGQTARPSESTRQLLPILIPHKLVTSYQLAGSFRIDASPAVALFSPDAQRFHLMSKGKVFSVLSGRNGAPMSAETDVARFDISDNRRYAAVLTDSGLVSVVDLQGEAEKKSFKELPRDLSSVALSPDGQRLLIYSKSRGFSLHNIDSGNAVGQLNDVVDGDPRFAFSPRGDRLVTWGTKGSNLTLWNAQLGTRVARLTDHWKPVGHVKFSRDGALIVTAALDDRATFWNGANGEAVKKFSFGPGEPIPTRSDFIAGGARLLAFVTPAPGRYNPSQLAAWDVTSGTLLATLLPDHVSSDAYHISPDEALIFISASDRNVYVHDLASLKRLNTLLGVRFVAFSPEGRRFLVASGEGLRLMDTQTLSPIARMPDQLAAFVGQKSGAMFASGSVDGTLSLWDFNNGDLIGQLKGHQDLVSTVVFSDDGRRLISMSSDDLAKLWVLPKIQDADRLLKDAFESTVEYHKRMADWSSPFSALVDLVGFNADKEIYVVRVGPVSVEVPIRRDAAKKLVGQRQATLSGTLKFVDIDQLLVDDSKLTRLP